MKYRRKPVIVEAVQFDPRRKPFPPGVAHSFNLDGTYLLYCTSNDIKPAVPIQIGDWIVIAADGKRSLVPMFDFHDFYEVVTEKEIADG